METIKSLVTTLTAVLIFISAIEIIVPDKKMKKYISFVLGLILLSTILNPIVEFITNGEKSILQGIESYETVFSMEEEKINADGEKLYDETGKDNEDIRKRAFINNFNKNCDSILNNEFKDMKFKSEVECDVDFNNLKINIKKLKLGIKDKKVRKVENIEIGKDKNDSVRDEYMNVINFASEELEIPKEKIEVYIIEE